MALTKIDDRGVTYPLDLIDNEKIRFGTGSDLEIFHDGSHSYIKDTGTGALYLDTNDIRIMNAAQDEYLIRGIQNSYVKLYYDGSEKLETTADGTLTSGTKAEISATGASDEPLLKITSENGGIFLRAAGSSGSFPTGGGGDDAELLYLGGDFRLGIGTASKNLIFMNGSSYNERARINSSGSFKLPDSAKIELGGAQTGSGDLQIYHDGSQSFISNNEGNLNIESKTGQKAIQMVPDGAVDLRYNGFKKIETTSSGVQIQNNNAPNTALDSTPVKLVLHNATDHNWDHNEHCGAIIFRKGLGEESSNTNNIVAAITGTHTRDGAGHTNEDGGIQIWTSPSANPTVPLVRWEVDHDGHLIGNGGYLKVNSEPDDRDEGQVLIWPRNISVDDDRIWIGTRDSASDKYKFCVDGTGEVRSHSNHLVGIQIDDHITPTNHYSGTDRLRFQSFRGTTDNANYRARAVFGTASSDWDDYRVLYYTDAQDDAAVDYDQDQTLSFSGSGRGNFKSHVWAGRVESDEGSPNSVYAGAERGFTAFANDGNDQTTCIARNVADTSHVYYSEVDNEANFSVQADGTCQADDTDNLANADYAETFEWTDGNTSNQERRGMTVILDGEKVKLATDSDNKDNIIGVVSPNPAVLGDSASLGWHGRYKKDVYGTPIRKPQEWLVWKKEYTYVDGVKTLCAQPDPTNPKTLEPADVERVKVEDIEKFKAKNLIPDFAITNNIRYTSYAKDIDTTTYDPTKAYIPRKDRKEWDAIGMVGKLIVRRGQPVGTRWLLMKENIGTDTDGTVLDRYLVR